MVRYLVDLWIIKNSGSLLFGKTVIKNLDNGLIAGLISALFTFADELGETLFRFITDKYQYFISEHVTPRFATLFVTRFPQNSSISKGEVLKELNAVEERFFERYSIEEIEDWDYDMNKFVDFGNDIIFQSEILEPIQS